MTISLGAEMLVNGGAVADFDQGRDRMEQAFSSGRAAELFGQMVSALGGPADMMEAPEKHLATAPVIKPVNAQTAGSVTHIATRDIGLAVVAMGGGRTRAADPVDPIVGFTDLAMTGDALEAGEPIGMVHAQSEAQAEEAAATLRDAYTLGPARDVPDRPVIIERIAE